MDNPQVLPASPDPLDILPPPNAPALADTKPKRGRGRKSAPSSLRQPAAPLRRSMRHSTETSTPGPSSVQVKQEGNEAPPPAKKRRGRPSEIPATAVEVKKEKDEVKVKEEGATKVKEESSTSGQFASAAAAGPSTSGVDVKPTLASSLSAAVAFQQPPVTAPPIAASSSAIPAPAAPKAKKPRKSAAEKAKELAEKPEKRSFKIRAKAPQATLQRAQRVMTQRMYLVHREKYPGTTLAEQFKVLGSTGNVYTIKIDSTPSCNCPDCMKGNLPCKHIIFVFLKVLKVPTDSPLWYQKSFLLSELEEIFTAAPSAPTDNLVSVKVRNAYLKAMGLGGDEEAEKEEELAAKEAEEAAAQAAKDGRKWTVGDDCPVCYDEMSAEDEQKGKLVFDEADGGCGKPLHAQCFKMWAATAKAKGDDVTCVWCRTLWPTADGAGAGKGKSKAAGGLDYSSLGYLNMADIAGMSRQRDTSSYYQGPIRGRRYDERYADD